MYKNINNRIDLVISQLLHIFLSSKWYKCLYSSGYDLINSWSNYITYFNFTYFLQLNKKSSKNSQRDTDSSLLQ